MNLSVTDPEKAAQDIPLPIHNEPQLDSPGPDLATHRRRYRKFAVIRALVSFLAFWLAFRLLGNLPHSYSRRHQKFQSIEHASISAIGWPIPADVTLVDCAGWEDDYKRRGRHFSVREDYSSYATFELPITSNKLFLLARGMTAGSVKIRYGSDSDDVKVSVEAHYRFQEALDNVKVCTIMRGEGENGLGMFGPEWSRRNGVRFDVILYLPKVEEGSVLQVPNFETDVPLFAQDVGDLEGSVYFDAFKLKSANAPIFVKSLGAENAIIETYNSPIRGSFNVSSSLRLQTANAPVDVDVNLYNDDEKAITDLQIRTSNSFINGALQLESAKETGGKFRVSASTALAPIDLVFSDAPVSSVLLLDAHTSFAPARVELHTTYEGTFDLATSFNRPEVIYKSKVEDPAGKGRHRKVEMNVRGDRVSGSTRWADDDEQLLGQVSIDTSFSPLTLKL